MGQIVILVLVVFAVLFLLLGVWLLIGQGSAGKARVMVRLKGVQQIKKYELGDALAETREMQLQKRQERKEALKKQAYSDVPILDRVLKRTSWAEKLNGMLIQSQFPITVTAFLSLSGLLAALGVAITIVWRRSFDPLLSLIIALVLGAVPFVFVSLKVRLRLKKFGSQLPDALDLLSSSVKAGQSLNAAIQNVGDEMPDPIADEFRLMSDELTFGVTFEMALAHLRTRVSTPDVRFFVTAMLIQKETGGNLSEVLDGLQKTIRERFRILGQVKTLTAQGKLSGLIVGVLPIVLGAGIYVMNPDYMGGLFTTKLGHTLIGVALGLEIVGGLIIRKIVRIKV